MKRRDLLAGVGGLGALAAGGAYALLRPAPERVEAVEVSGIDATGSSSGDVSVPAAGRTSFVEFFATWCSTCQSMMPEISKARSRLDDVDFVSVTYEPVGQTVSEQEVADWWQENGGDWQVAYDVDYEATRAFDAAGVPTSYVVTPEGFVGWSDAGYHSADEIVHAVDEHGGR